MLRRNLRLKKRHIGVIILLALLAASGLGTGLYVNDYYHASESAMALVEEGETENGVEIHQVSDTYVFQ